METLPFIDHMKSQPSWLLLLSSLGFLSLFKFTTSLLKWVYTTFLRPPKNLKNYGSWALVTGATDGIGKCMAFQLAQQGLHLILLGRNADKLRDVSDAIEAKFRETKIKKVVVDLAGDLTEGIEKIGGAIEGLDVGVLINCAGFADSRLRFFHEVDEEAMKSMVRVNIESTTKVTKVVLKGMKERKRGAIVNIGSGSAVISPCLPLSAVYAATKAYISQFSRGLYVEYKKSGIDVQCQIPFYVSTKMVGFKTQSFFTPSPEAYSQAAVRWIGYIHQFSRNLHVEYKQHGIDVQCQIPEFVKTKMLPFRFSSFFIPTPEVYSRACLRWIGYEPVCYPYWRHSLQRTLAQAMPKEFLDWAALQLVLHLRERENSKSQKKKPSREFQLSYLLMGLN